MLNFAQSISEKNKFIEILFRFNPLNPKICILGIFCQKVWVSLTWNEKADKPLKNCFSLLIHLKVCWYSNRVS